MSIITLQKNHTDFTGQPGYIDLPDHTAFPSNLLNDRNLSGGSLALITYLLVQPDASIVDTQNKAIFGSAYARSKSLKRLVHFGYLIIGRIDRQALIWHVYDTPQNGIPQDIYVPTMGDK